MSWISVEQELPELEKEVLIFYKGEQIQAGLYNGDDGLEWWCELLGGWNIDWDKVTHWQPLPEPPK